MNIIRVIQNLMLLLLMSNCATKQGIDPRVAISIDEWLPETSNEQTFASLSRAYYSQVLSGHSGNGDFALLLQGDTSELGTLFDRRDSLDLDGEYSLRVDYDLVFALTIVGDDVYAEALSKEPLKTKQNVSRGVLSVLHNLKGKVPRTEAICQ